MRCCECGDPIAECMGFVLAGDFAEACEGKRPWNTVRQRCWRCVERALLSVMS